MSRKTIVVALGGNAIIEEGTEGTMAEQFENTRKSMDAIVGLIRGAHILRVHDVKSVGQAARVADAVLAAGREVQPC